MPFEFPPAAFTPGQQLGVPVLGLDQATFGSRHAPFPVLVGLADLLVGPLQQLGEGQLYVGRDAFDFGKTFLTGFVQEWSQRRLVKPRGSLLGHGDVW